MLQTQPGGRGRAAVRHAHECVRHRPVHADRARAVPQARGRRRHRARLRDQPQLPQRGRRLDALAGIRDARGVRGLRRLRHDGGTDPGPRADAPRSTFWARRRSTLPDGSEYELGGAVGAAVDVRLAGGVAGRWRSRPRRRWTTCWCSRRSSRSRPTRRSVNHGKLVELLWEHRVGDDLHAPTFVRDFPVETSPLVRAAPHAARASSRSGTSTCAASSWRRATPSSSTR